MKRFAAYYLVSLALLCAHQWGSLGQEYFFDEAWRVDYIHSADPMARYWTNNAPIPPLWIWLMRGTAGGMHNYAGMRLMANVYSALFPALFGLLTYSMIRITDQPVRTALSAGGDRKAQLCGLSGLIFAISVGGSIASSGNNLAITDYLNDYFFQSAAVAAFMLCWILCDQNRLKPTQVAAAWIMIPFATIGGLFVLPAASIWWFWRHYTPGQRIVMTIARALSLPAVTLLISVLIAKYGYLPVVDRSLTAFWGNEFIRPDSTILEIISRGLEAIGNGVLSKPTGLPESSRWSLARGLAVALLSVYGVAVFFRTWRWLGIAILTNLVAILLFSWLGLWPAYMNRVNFPALWLIYWAGWLGVIRLVEHLPYPSRGRSLGPALISLLGATALMAGAPSNAPASSALYARGLYEDLEQIKALGLADNLVFSYHFMSHFYTHDSLINGGVAGKRFLIFRETRGDPSLYRDLGAIIAQHDPAGRRAIFCIRPYELGPVDFERACVFGSSRYHKVLEVRGKRAGIVAYYPQ